MQRKGWGGAEAGVHHSVHILVSGSGGEGGCLGPSGGSTWSSHFQGSVPSLSGSGQPLLTATGCWLL